MAEHHPQDWYEYANRYVPSSSVGTFKALFAGMDCYDMSYFWNKYLAETEFERKDLLMAVGFASGYDKNWRSIASRWSVGHDNIENRIWNILDYLGPELNEVRHSLVTSYSTSSFRSLPFIFNLLFPTYFGCQVLKILGDPFPSSSNLASFFALFISQLTLLLADEPC